MAEGEKVYPVV